MAFDAVLEFGQFRHDLLIRGQRFTHANKSADHEYAHIVRALGVQY